MKVIISALVAILLIVFLFLKSLSPGDLLVGATNSDSFYMPSVVFVFYIKQSKAIPGNYLTETGLPAIVFIANGRLEQKNGTLEMIRYFLDSGANINETGKDKLGLAALHTAVLNADQQLVQFLLQKGANVNALAGGEKYKGLTPLAFAKLLNADKSKPQLKIIQTLLQERGGLE